MDAADPLKAAVECFKARRDRKEHPEGEFTGPPNDRTWSIDADERRPCCAKAEPSDLGGKEKFRGHWLNSHCRTIVHVANLFGVAEAALRAALKAKPAPAGQLKLF